MADVAVTSQNASKYTLRWKGSACWAVFFVDEETYCLSVLSDYGDYAYRWGQPGESFKKFLTTCDRSYVIGKLGQGDGKWFDADKTIENLERHVEELLKSKALTSRQKDDIEDHLQEIKDWGARTNEGFSVILMQGAIAEHTPDFYESARDIFVTGHHPQLVSFMDKIWPEFIAALKKEVAGSSQSRASLT